MKLNTHYKIIILVAVLTFLAVGIVAGIILPTIGYINKLDQETYELMIYLEKRYQSVAKLKMSMRNFDEVKLGVDAFKPFLFTVGDELKLITTLEDVAVKNKVKQKINSADWGKDPNGQKNISLTIDGEYQDLLNYMADVEKTNYFLHIEKLQFTPGFNRKGEFTNNAELNLNLSFYANN